MNINKYTNIRAVCKNFPELYSYDYKWIESKHYRDLNEILDRGRCTKCGEIASGTSDYVFMVGTHKTRYLICSPECNDIVIKISEQ